MSFSESGMTPDQERMFPDQVCLFQNQECMFPDREMWTFPNKNKYLKPNFLIANIILMHKFIQIRMRQDSLCVQPRQLCLTFTSIYEQIFLQIVSTRGNTISHLFYKCILWSWTFFMFLSHYWFCWKWFNSSSWETCKENYITSSYLSPIVNVLLSRSPVGCLSV